MCGVLVVTNTHTMSCAYYYAKHTCAHTKQPNNGYQKHIKRMVKGTRVGVWNTSLVPRSHQFRASGRGYTASRPCRSRDCDDLYQLMPYQLHCMYRQQRDTNVHTSNKESYQNSKYKSHTHHLPNGEGFDGFSLMPLAVHTHSLSHLNGRVEPHLAVLVLAWWHCTRLVVGGVWWN